MCVNVFLYSGVYCLSLLRCVLILCFFVCEDNYMYVYIVYYYNIIYDICIVPYNTIL